MRILDFEICHKNNEDCRLQNLDSSVVLIHSSLNMTGKTTFIRAILYSLGYNIPDTQMVRFKDYTFKLNVLVKNKQFSLIRDNNIIKINDNEYDLPSDRYLAHQYLFDTTNQGILYNLLATHYFDQEKGWTLLNRGTIIGENKFNIESFFRALNGHENLELINKIDYLETQVRKYKLMFDVGKYQEKVNEEGLKQVSYTTRDEEIEIRLSSLRFREAEIDAEISSLNKVINENKSFVKYIEKKRLTVDYEDITIPVNSKTLTYFSENDDYSLERKKMLINERIKIKNEISQLLVEENQTRSLVDIKDQIELFAEKLSNIDIDVLQMERIINELKKEKQNLEKILQDQTQHNNEWINDFFHIVHSYIDELELPFEMKKLMIFTRKLKGLSGAILHKLVFSYKLGYIKLIEKNLGIKLPIFIDSPNGREVNQQTILKMMEILKRDFSDYQIIIASIHDYKKDFERFIVIEMKRQFFVSSKDQLV